ncbi:MAG: hypothetical protein K1X36_04340 [Pyrinomonadaceae bacterium]|nr:hypothetical protein [Pyrinomonadaceae bacterium]
MVPSQTWFPTNLAARAAWYANFTAQFVGTYAGMLGLTTYTGVITKDNDDFQSIAATRLAAKNFDRAVADFLRELTEAPIGSPQPVFPSESFTAPPQGVAAGIFQRLDELRTLIMAQPNYTEAMGTAMGIETTKSTPISPPSVKPTIVAEAASTGYHFSVIAGNRQEADQWRVMVLRKGAAGWVNAETATGKSVDVHLTPQVPGEPEQIQVRIQLRKNNEDYGQPSDIVYVTINP